MTYSYTQVSQYLACPRRYRYRYAEGWREKDTRAAMLFGRAFEQALAAYFLDRDPAEVLFQQWSRYRDQPLEYSKAETWDQMWQQGRQLLDRFAQQDRVAVPEPQKNLQVKSLRPLSPSTDFLAYVDAIGMLDGKPCLLEWKTSSRCIPHQPEGLAALDPQLIAYSWATGLPEVALVVFVRKQLVEIQYLRATITAAQREEFEGLLRQTIAQIEGAQFLRHSGIRFPQNGCLSCPFLGLCLQRPDLIATSLVRQPEAELDWVYQLDY